jgi:type 1 fimbria pilin
MKLKISILAISSLLVGSLVALPAEAQDSSVTISGSVKAGTCVVDPVEVDLGEIGADEFPQIPANPGSSSVRVDGSVEFRDCAGVAAAKLTFGEAADNDSGNGMNNHFRNKAGDSAPFTNLWLMAGNCSSGPTETIRPGQPRADNVVINGQTASFDFCVRPYKLGGGLVTSGGISTQFVLGVEYF